jgi:NADPH-dependent 2,4-dienoyl-CoA reductase/sulfur reductase-like enzyme
MARLARLCGCTHEYDPVLNFWKPQKDNYMRSSLSDIYVAGDSAGIKGKDLAEVEGRIAATHMAFKLHRLSISAMKKRMGHLKKRQEHIQGYSSMLNKVYRLEPGLYGAMDRETVVCRCEDMTVGDVLEGIEMGYKNINEIKRTRVGMGMCQGKICESIVQQIMHQKGIPIEEIGYLNLRPPLSPIPLSSFEIHADSEI